MAPLNLFGNWDNTLRRNRIVLPFMVRYLTMNRKAHRYRSPLPFALNQDGALSKIHHPGIRSLFRMKSMWILSV